MLKMTAVALGLLVAAGAASTAANATDYRYGYSGRDRVYHGYRSDWRYQPPRRHVDRYDHHHWRKWRAEREHRRHARWWRRDY